MIWIERFRGRAATTVLLLGFGFLVLLPNWLALPPDDENLSKEIVGTVFQSKAIFAGHYPFWNPFVAFGVPEPLSQTLVFHPFLLFVEILPLAAAVGAFYQLQMWIGLLAVWAVARRFGIRPAVAALCVLTYALSSSTLVYLTNLWPVNFVDWTLAPLLLLLLLGLFDAETTSLRVVYSVGAGLCAGFMVLDGHLGWLVDYAVPYLAFLAPQWRQAQRVWRWLALTLAVLAVTAVSHVYDVALESSNALTGRNNQETVGMNVWRLIFYPIGPPHGGSNATRAIAIGGPYFLLAAIGLVYPLRHRYASSLRAGVVVSFLFWFVPLHWSSILSTNYAAAAPFTIFAVFLAGLTLQALWQRFSRWRWALLGAAGLQVLVLVAGFYPYYRDEVNLVGSRSSLKTALENQPIYRDFEARPGIQDTRIYLAPGADKRLFRKQPDYKFEGWQLHGLRLVNGLFKGIDLHEFTPVKVYLRGEIRGDPRVAGSKPTLAALNVGYVLAGAHEQVAPGLIRLFDYVLQDPVAEIALYRNPGAWPDAVVLTRAPATLPRRDGCDTPGLLCADFRPVARARVRGAVRGERWNGSDLSVRLRPTAGKSVLMLSQLYRPGWEATLSNRTTVSGYRLFGGLTGFDLPAGTTSATITFTPTTRILLTSISWAAIFFGFLAMLAAPLVAARRRRVVD